MCVTTDSKEKTFELHGKLDFATVSLLDKDNRKLVMENQQLIFDLSQVTVGDNAGVALLVSLASYAKSLDRKISFVNLPEQLLDLIEAKGVKNILPIS